MVKRFARSSDGGRRLRRPPVFREKGPAKRVVSAEIGRRQSSATDERVKRFDILSTHSVSNR